MMFGYPNTIGIEEKYVNNTTTQSCVVNINFEIDLNDVLESIRVLLYYIRKTARNKGLVPKSKNIFLVITYCPVCLICLILEIKHPTETGQYDTIIIVEEPLRCLTVRGSRPKYTAKHLSIYFNIF